MIGEKLPPSWRSRLNMGAFLGIFITVILFNLIAVFGLDALLHDDPAHYRMVLRGEFPWRMMEFNLLAPFSEWIGWSVMAFSPHLARGLYVLLLMVPISCCFFYLCHAAFGFSRAAAFAAAVLPCILPMQWQIPAGINMSYVLWVYIFSLLSLILGLQYLRAGSASDWKRPGAAAMLYLAATQINEQALFLLPPFALAFWGLRRLDKKGIILLSGFFAVAAVKWMQVTAHPRVQPVGLPAREIFRRIGLYFQWSLPFGEIAPIWAATIFIGVAAAGFICSMNSANDGSGPRWIPVYCFFFCWIISTSFVFIFLHRAFSPRLIFISSFGVIAILIFSLSALAERIPGQRHNYVVLLFAILLISSGTLRFFYLQSDFEKRNDTQKTICQNLQAIAFPLDAQIVIVGEETIPGGWERSSGYLQYALKRKDISGLIGPVNFGNWYNFYEHFDPDERGFGNRYNMTGLSLKKPLFFFAKGKSGGKMNQIQYVLHWRGAAKDSLWTIFKADKTSGEMSAMASGRGMEEYLSAIAALRTKGICQSDILWGGPPTKEEQIRLENGGSN